MMKKTLLSLLFVSSVVAVIVTSLENASAIPPFARKYKTNCQTCHTAFPKLNPFGMAYRANGYRFPGGDEIFVKDDPISMGADANKRLFPKALWPSDIPYLPPIGLTMFTNFYVGEDTDTTTEFDGIEEIGFLTGGTLGESFSFFMDWRMYQWGQKRGWLDRAFINWRPVRINEFLGDLATNIFNIKEIEYPSGIFNVRLGQFEPRATPMLGGHRNLITIKGTPNAVSWPMPAPIAGGGGANMWGFFPNQKGIEFYGGLNGPRGKGGFEWAFGVVNGEESITEMSAGSVSGRRPTLDRGRFDDNDYKDIYGKLSFKFGGLGVMGGGEVETSDISLETWQDGKIIRTPFGNIATSAKIGIFYYSGKTGRNISDDPTRQLLPENRLTRYGVDLDWIIGNANIIASAVVYRDQYKEPFAFADDGIDDTFKTNIYTAEIDYVIFPWLVPAVRYEWIRPDYSFTMPSIYEGGENVTTKDWELLTFDVAILAAANIKILAGGVFSIGEPPPTTSHFRDYFRFGVDIAY